MYGIVNCIEAHCKMQQYLAWNEWHRKHMCSAGSFGNHSMKVSSVFLLSINSSCVRQEEYSKQRIKLSYVFASFHFSRLLLLLLLHTAPNLPFINFFFLLFSFFPRTEPTRSSSVCFGEWKNLTEGKKFKANYSATTEKLSLFAKQIAAQRYRQNKRYMSVQIQLYISRLCVC